MCRPSYPNVAVFCWPVYPYFPLCPPPLPPPPPVNRRMDQWVVTSEMDLDSVEMQLEEVGPDGK